MKVERGACAERGACLQNAEDAAYLVKYLLNGSTGTPMKDMLRTVTRTFRSRPVDRKTVSVSHFYWP